MLSIESLPWILLQNFVNAATYARRSTWLTSEDQPDELKTYPGKEHLFASRIFRPTGSAKERQLPLIICIHGGGFIMNSPAADDKLARYLSNNVECVAISVDYSKAPLHPFPAGYEDLVDLTLAIISDGSLRIDPRHVVLLGRSSGANLALGVAQDIRLRGKLAGVLASTPAVDLAMPFEEKMASRPDPGIPDFLAGMYGKIFQFYNPGGTALEDVRLSPTNFSQRADLPEHLYFIGAEHDLLRKEAEMMAEKVAEGLTKERTEDGWVAGNIKWSFIQGQKHGFETFAEKDKQREAARLVAVEHLFSELSSWLKAVFEDA